MTQKLTEEWLNSLAVGHEWTAVIPYAHQSVGGRVITVKVARRTATQIIVLVGKEERRYRANDGRLVGNSWEKIPLPASEECITESRRGNRYLSMISRLRQCDFSKLPYETVEAMFKLLPASAPEES
jgi:hypothetical protein